MGCLKPKDQQWCCGCAQRGHLEHVCPNIARQHPATAPYISTYPPGTKTLPCKNPPQSSTSAHSPAPSSRVPLSFENRSFTIFHMKTFYLEWIRENADYISSNFSHMTFELHQRGSKCGFIQLAETHTIYEDVVKLYDLLQSKTFNRKLTLPCNKDILALIDKCHDDITKVVLIDDFDPCLLFAQIRAYLRYVHSKIAVGRFESAFANKLVSQFDLEEQYAKLNTFLFGVKRAHDGGDTLEYLSGVRDDLRATPEFPGKAQMRRKVAAAHQFMCTSGDFYKQNYVELIAGATRQDEADVRMRVDELTAYYYEFLNK